VVVAARSSLPGAQQTQKLQGVTETRMHPGRRRRAAEQHAGICYSSRYRTQEHPGPAGRCRYGTPVQEKAGDPACSMHAPSGRNGRTIPGRQAPRRNVQQQAGREMRHSSTEGRQWQKQPRYPGRHHAGSVAASQWQNRQAPRQAGPMPYRKSTEQKYMYIYRNYYRAAVYRSSFCTSIYKAMHPYIHVQKIYMKLYKLYRRSRRYVGEQQATHAVYMLQVYR